RPRPAVADVQCAIVVVPAGPGAGHRHLADRAFFATDESVLVADRAAGLDEQAAGAQVPDDEVLLIVPGRVGAGDRDLAFRACLRSDGRRRALHHAAIEDFQDALASIADGQRPVVDPVRADAGHQDPAAGRIRGIADDAVVVLELARSEEHTSEL